MDGFFSRIAAVLLPVVFIASCSRDSDVIPRDKMAKIYAEMFVTDQWISSHPQARRAADTSFVYEPIFEKYGYDSDDYRKSMDFYLQDPDRYARILRQSSVLIEDRLRELRKEKEIQESLTRMQSGIDLYAPEKIYFLTGIRNPDLVLLDSMTFYVDSTGGRFDFDPQTGLDTLFSGPELIVADSVSFAEPDSAATEVADTVVRVTHRKTRTPFKTPARAGEAEIRKDFKLIEK